MQGGNQATEEMTAEGVESSGSIRVDGSRVINGRDAIKRVCAYGRTSPANMPLGWETRKGKDTAGGPARPESHVASVQGSGKLRPPSCMFP